MAQKKKKFYIITFLCLIGLVFGGGLALLFPKLFDAILNKQMTLIDGTPAYKVWKKTEEPSLLKIFMFHVVNPHEIVKNGAKPYLIQKGPYVYREFKERTEIQHFPSNYSTTYRERRFWHFEPTMSNGTLEDYITTINLPLLASQEAQRGDYWQSWMLDATFSAIEAQLFVNKTVKDLLFDGYEDTLLSIAQMAGAKSRTPLDKFGWFYKRNGTVWGEGVYNMYTGEDDPQKIGRIHTWDGSNRTHYSGKCGEIRGSAGGFFPPHINSPTIELFSHDACRSLTYQSTGQIKHINQIPGKVYELPTTTFANGTVHPPNQCFENNLPSGVHNATYCKAEKSPLFISFPHFYGADPYFIDQFDSRSNFRPNKDEHGSRVVLFSDMGIPTEFILRLQLNMRIHPNPDISVMTKVPKDLYLPSLWFEGSGSITDDSADVILKLFDIPQLVIFIGFAVSFMCLVGALVSIFLACNPRRTEFQSLSTKEEGGADAFFVEKNNTNCDLSLLACSSTGTPILKIQAA